MVSMTAGSSHITTRLRTIHEGIEKRNVERCAFVMAGLGGCACIGFCVMLIVIDSANGNEFPNAATAPIVAWLAMEAVAEWSVIANQKLFLDPRLYCIPLGFALFGIPLRLIFSLLVLMREGGAASKGEATSSLVFIATFCLLHAIYNIVLVLVIFMAKHRMECRQRDIAERRRRLTEAGLHHYSPSSTTNASAPPSGHGSVSGASSYAASCAAATAHDQHGNNRSYSTTAPTATAGEGGVGKLVMATEGGVRRCGADPGGVKHDGDRGGVDATPEGMVEIDLHSDSVSRKSVVAAS